MDLNLFLDLIKSHNYFRKKSLNLIASENCTSPLVRAILATDLGNRYSADFYGGTKYIRRILNSTDAFLRDLFNVNYSIISALSGNLCVLALILGLTKNNEKVLVVDAGDCGGYPLDYNFFGRKKVTFKFSIEDMNLLVNENIELIKQEKPRLVIFGASFLPFAQPIKDIISEFSKKKNIHFAYDGSHVLGLIAGKQFQDPLREGSHILIGSTHKSFPGPQGGVVLTDDMGIYERLQAVLDLDLEKGIRLVDNNHPNRIAALGMATLEMIEFGTEYAKQVIQNSKVLAKTLFELSIPVKYRKLGFTDSHQVIIDTPNYQEGVQLRERAENYGLIIDAGIRLGTSEITRLGMKELEVREIADIFSKIYFNKDTRDIPRRIESLCNLFNEPIYCFDQYEYSLL